MRKFLTGIVFLVLLVGFIDNGLSDKITLNGSDGVACIQAGEDGIIKQNDFVVLSSGAEGEDQISTIGFLFPGDKNAIGFKVFTKHNGLGIIYIPYASHPDEKRGITVDINGFGEDKPNPTFEPVTLFLSRKNEIEVHVSVFNGQVITLHSISVEFIYKETTKVIVRERYGLPPGWRYSAWAYYNQGPILVWDNGYYVVYKNWYYSKPYIVWARTYTAPSVVYYYHYCNRPYVREEHIYFNGYNGSGGSRRKESERWDSIQRRAPERVRSVEGNSNSRRAPAVRNSLKLQNGSDRSKTVISEEKANSVVGSAKGTKQLSREAVAGIIQRSQARKDIRVSRSVRPSSFVTGEVTTKDLIQFSDGRRRIESKGQQQGVRRQQAVDAGNIARRVKQSAVVGPTESRTIMPRVEASPGKASWLEQTVGRMKQTAQRAVVVRPGGNSGGSSVKRAPSNTSSPARQRSVVEAAKQVVRPTTTTSSQQAPATTAAQTETLRRIESSTKSSSSSSDDDEQKKRKRRVRNSR